MRPSGVIDLPVPGSSQPALVIIPGFGETYLSFGPFARHLRGATGRRTVFVGSPSRTAQCRPEPEYPQPLLRLADNICCQLAQRNIHDATGIFHSMGGITGLIAACRRPGSFKRVIVVCGAGHLPKDRFWRLVGAVSHKTWRCLVDSFRDPDRYVRRANRIALLDGLRYLAVNWRRIIGEGRGVAHYNTADLIRQLETAGTEVWVILAEKDVVFQATLVQQALAFLPPERVISVPGRPHDLHLRPEELTLLLKENHLV